MSEHQQMHQSKKPDSTFQKQAALTSQNSVSHPATIIQRARINPKSLTPADVLQLQRTIGNRAVGRLLSEIRNPSKVQQGPIQRQEVPEEEKEPLQGMFGKEPEEETCPSCVQRQEKPEEEEPLQGKFETIQRLEPEEEEKLQMKSVVQRQEMPEEEEPLQGKMIGTIQRQEIPEEEPPQKKSENNTGMSDNLKAGVENLSGIDMSDVRVHYNSDKPAKVGALAYTQGTNIHVAPGQEKYLPHETWHVIQQAQGRVRPNMQLKDVAVNDDVELEREADEMGKRVVKINNLLHDTRTKPVVRNVEKQDINSANSNEKDSIDCLPLLYNRKNFDGQTIQRVMANVYWDDTDPPVGPLVTDAATERSGSAGGAHSTAHGVFEWVAINAVLHKNFTLAVSNLLARFDDIKLLPGYKSDPVNQKYYDDKINTIKSKPEHSNPATVRDVKHTQVLQDLMVEYMVLRNDINYTYIDGKKGTKGIGEKSEKAGLKEMKEAHTSFIQGEANTGGKLTKKFASGMDKVLDLDVLGSGAYEMWWPSRLSQHILTCFQAFPEISPEVKVAITNNFLTKIINSKIQSKKMKKENGEDMKGIIQLLTDIQLA